MDVAPDASLYIANPATWDDLRNSVEAGRQVMICRRWDDTWVGATKDLRLEIVSDPGTASELATGGHLVVEADPPLEGS